MVLVFLAVLLGGSLLQAQDLGDGVLAMEAGRLDEAERILSAVVRQHPDSGDANFYLGLVHFRAGRSAAARPPLERAVSLSPGSARAWKLLGLVTTSDGDLDRAVSALGKACDLDGNDEESCYY